MLAALASLRRATITPAVGCSREMESRERLGPMPEALWGSTVELGRELGVGRVARALGLNSSAVKNRVEPMKNERVKRARKWARSRFVEVKTAPVAAASSSTVIELMLTTGNRLTERLNEVVDVGALLSSFQGRL